MKNCLGKWNEVPEEYCVECDHEWELCVDILREKPQNIVIITEETQ